MMLLIGVVFSISSF